MNDQIGLNAQGESDKIALKSLSWTGLIDGLVFTCKATQEYINTDTKTLEISYTFPLSWEAVVTDFAAEIGGKRLVATPMPKKAAETKYEKALAEGDLPLLLQCSDETLGLYTANLGNLKPGETVKVEIGTAQLLVWNRGAVRFNLPTVIAERYSPDGTQGNLLPHESVYSSIFANYKGSAKITVRGPLAKGRLTCLSHQATYLNGVDETEIEIAQAKPDKDIAFLFEDVEAVPSARRIVPLDHPENAIEVCTFYPLAEHRARSLDLNILVDCSGSMDGIPITQARQALKNLFENLNGDDTITFTRFGSDYIHDIPRSLALTPMTVRRDIDPFLEKLDADLGGTEMAKALSSVLKIANPSSDILLITDGDIWNAEDVIKKASDGGHRIFVIGVSTAPAEPLLRQMAEKTNGACAVVMPAEDMRPVLIKMVEKMRTRQSTYELSRGESKEEVNLWSGQSATFIWNESRPSSLPELKCLSDPEEKVLNPNRWVPSSSAELYAALIKIFALKLYRKSNDEEKCELIANKYGLLSPFVSFVMVHERAEADKFKGFPEALITPQMVVGQTLTSPEFIDLGNGMKWAGRGREPDWLAEDHKAKNIRRDEGFGCAGGFFDEIFKPMESQEVTSNFESSTQSHSEDSPFTNNQEFWIAKKLCFINAYFDLYGFNGDLKSLVNENEKSLLSENLTENLSDCAQRALVIVLLDLYWQKFIKKGKESDPLQDASRAQLLTWIPFNEDYIRDNYEKLMPMESLSKFLAQVQDATKK